MGQGLYRAEATFKSNRAAKAAAANLAEWLEAQAKRHEAIMADGGVVQEDYGDPGCSSDVQVDGHTVSYEMVVWHMASWDELLDVMANGEAVEAKWSNTETGHGSTLKTHQGPYV